MACPAKIKNPESCHFQGNRVKAGSRLILSRIQVISRDANHLELSCNLAGATRLELATSGVTGHSSRSQTLGLP